MYVAGFVIECLLKAFMLERHPNLAGRVNTASLSVSDKEAYSLLFTHDLAELLIAPPEVETKLKNVGTVDRAILTRFREVCAEWTIYARYSPHDADRSDAERFVSTIVEVRKWLKEL